MVWHRRWFGPLIARLNPSPDKLSDEAARTKAGRLGLKEDLAGDHREMWLAIEKFLSTALGSP